MKTIKLAGLLCALFFAAIAASGCAAGNRYDFSKTAPMPGFHSEQSVAVASHDQRPDVTSGRYEPDYVGVQRDALGNPFRVHTQSGHPFVRHAAESLAAALKDSGFNAETVLIQPPDADREHALETMLRVNADRYILLTVNQWKSDTYSNIGLEYDLDLTVYNAEGKFLAKNTLTGTESIPGSLLKPAAAAARKIPRAYQRILGKLLDAEVVENKLKN